MTSPPTRIEAYRAARERVLARIADACARAGRAPDDVTLVAVSKTVAAEALRDAVAAGLDLLGENRVQEGVAKAPEVARRALAAGRSAPVEQGAPGARGLRIDPDGGLRRPRPAARPARARGAARTAAIRSSLQVNVDLDPAKAGFAADELEAALDELLALPHLAVGGLMTVGRLTSDPAEARRTFRGLRELSERFRGRWPGLGPALSMGMTDDFELAVEEGATIVRVGRALFGERAHHEP